MRTAVIKHSVPDGVNPSFVIFDIRAPWRSGLSVRVPGCQKLQMTAYPRLAQDALYLYPYDNSGRQKAELRLTTVIKANDDAAAVPSCYHTWCRWRLVVHRSCNSTESPDDNTSLCDTTGRRSPCPTTVDRTRETTLQWTTQSTVVGDAAVSASDFRSSGRGRSVTKAPKSTQPSIPPG